MTLDTSDLRSTIEALEEQVARLRQIADAAESQSSRVADLAAVGLTLPPEVIVTRPDEIAQYLRKHPDLTAVVGEMAAALVEEFRGERSEIEVVLYQDPEIDDRYLTLYVRVPNYDDTLVPRLDAVWERVDSGYPPTPEWVQVTTDHRPIR